MVSLSLLVSLHLSAAVAETARDPIRNISTVPRLPCSPFGIGTGIQHIFDAVAAGHPALAVNRVLGPAHSDTMFDQYQFGAYGGGIPSSAPINQVATLRSSLLQAFALRSKQHDTASLLGLHIESVGSYTRDSIGFTVGLTRQADDLRHRTLLYGIAKGVWLCNSRMVQRFFGAVLLDRQPQMHDQATHICPTRARRTGIIRVCW